MASHICKKTYAPISTDQLPGILKGLGNCHFLEEKACLIDLADDFQREEIKRNTFIED